jgi:hypothetical protein
MPRGSSAKREREYEELKQEFKKDHRYPGREEQVAARIVNKQRREFGETKGQKQEEKQGKAPDRGLPIQGYEHMTIGQIRGKLDDLGKREVRKVAEFEKSHKNRKTLVQELETRLQ